MPEVMRDTFIDQDPGNFQPGMKGFHDPANAGTYVTFYWNKVAEQHFCKKRFAGDKDKVWDQPVRERDKIEFPAQWQAYESGQDQLQGQTRIEAWGEIDEGSIAIYRSLHIATVEQLSALPDTNLGNFPSGHRPLAVRHRAMATEYLETQAQSKAANAAVAAAEQSAAVAQQALEENAALKLQLDRLMARLDKQEAGPSEPVAAEDSYPRHAGGPWYRLSNGEKIKGKAEAEAAQEKLDAA